VAKNPADNSIPPPLRALGGWVEADWFDPAILHQTEVVGMTLPALGGGRKQNFELVERFAQPPAVKAKKRAAKSDEVKAAAGTIGELIEQAGSTHGAAFRRVKFFFEAPASLFFAAVPAANLKARAADGLRKDLIRLAFRGCVLNWGDDGVVAMFWPSSETDVTAFVRAARPAHALHPQFDEAEEERRLAEPVRRGLLGGGRAAPPPVVEVAARRPSKSDDKARRLLAAERNRLLEELEQLRGRIVELQASQSTVGAMEALGLDDARLRSMLLLLHPDKHGNSEAANEAAKWVNGLRDVLKTRK
jgi:hypothetical protein